MAPLLWACTGIILFIIRYSQCQKADTYMILKQIWCRRRHYKESAAAVPSDLDW